MKVNLKELAHTNPKEEHKRRPFTLVDRQGSTWNVATNGWWLVAVKGSSQIPRWSGCSFDLNVMLTLIQGKPDNPFKVSRKTLKAWAQNDLGEIYGKHVDLKLFRRLLELFRDVDSLVIGDMTEVIGVTCFSLVSGTSRRVFLAGTEVAPEEQTTAARLDLAKEGSSLIKERPRQAPAPIDETEMSGFDLALALGEAD